MSQAERNYKRLYLLRKEALTYDTSLTPLRDELIDNFCVQNKNKYHKDQVKSQTLNLLFDESDNFKQLQFEMDTFVSFRNNLVENNNIQPFDIFINELKFGDNNSRLSTTLLSVLKRKFNENGYIINYLRDIKDSDLTDKTFQIVNVYIISGDGMILTYSDPTVFAIEEGLYTKNDNELDTSTEQVMNRLNYDIDDESVCEQYYQVGGLKGFVDYVPAVGLNTFLVGNKLLLNVISYDVSDIYKYNILLTVPETYRKYVLKEYRSRIDWNVMDRIVTAYLIGDEPLKKRNFEQLKTRINKISTNENKLFNKQILQLIKNENQYIQFQPTMACYKDLCPVLGIIREFQAWVKLYIDDIQRCRMVQQAKLKQNML